MSTEIDPEQTLPIQTLPRCRIRISAGCNQREQTIAGVVAFAVEMVTGLRCDARSWKPLRGRITRAPRPEDTGLVTAMREWG
jgi:hypothetical protein